MNTEHKQKLLDKLLIKYKKSKPCHNYKHSKNIVFGEGDINAKLMFIGEAPGAEEDKQGVPFVGRSGQLLIQALFSNDIKRSDIYITNVIKCRPPNNRTPLTTEIKKSVDTVLIDQINIINPKVIVTLGTVPLRALINPNLKITKVHGSLFKFNNITVTPIFHPAYILRNRSLTKTWLNDIKKIKSITKDF